MTMVNVVPTTIILETFLMLQIRLVNLAHCLLYKQASTNKDYRDLVDKGLITEVKSLSCESSFTSISTLSNVLTCRLCSVAACVHCY